MTEAASDRAALIGLLHPIPVGFTVAVGAGFGLLAADGAPPVDRLALFLTSLTLTQCAISVHNDYCDRELDARAKPWRALPRRLISPSAALALSAALVGIGLLCSAVLGPIVFILALLGTGAGFAYSGGLKKTAASWVPFVVGFPTLALWAFAAVGTLELRLLSVYVVGLPLVLAVHLADTLPDLSGDTAGGVRGLAHRLDPRQARALCWVSLASALVAALVARGFPSLLWMVGLACLVAAVAIGFRSVGRAHWLTVMLGAAVLGLDWLSFLAR